MRILFDPQIFGLQTYGGISRYYCELMNGLSKFDHVTTELGAWFSNNAYLKRSGSTAPKPFFSDRNFPGKQELMNTINKFFCIGKMLRGNYEIFHPTYYDPYFLSWLDDKPFVLTIYDMIHERYEDIRSVEKDVSENKRMLAHRAKKIIAISASTKRDIVTYFSVAESKIDVVYLGNSISPKTANGRNIFLPENYVLYVGSRSHYKNYRFFLGAIGPLLHRDEKLFLVCTGGGEFTEIELSDHRSLGVERKVLYHPLTDDLLGHLYNGARVFVFPSHYEGFGIPVLEAFACGCPAALSNTSSLPEIAGDAALFFDPLDECSIRKTVEKIIYDEGTRNELIARGLERVKEFSWEKTARETKEIYDSLL